MKVAVHQPEHLPYFGFFDKINKSDIFVVLDDVQYARRNVQNRNRILTSSGINWITVPLVKKDRSTTIQEQETYNGWKFNYRNKIVEAYKCSPYFNEGIDLIDNMLGLSSDRLIDYNMYYIKNLIDVLQIKTKIVMSSELDINTKGSQRIIDICNRLNSSQYIAGPGSKKYLKSNDLKIENHSSKFIEYKQVNSNAFIPMLSTLDIVMSIGVDKLSEMLTNAN